MRRPFSPFVAMLVVLAACSDSTGPTTEAISGTWRSMDFADAEFSMTIVETARAVEGAGRLVTDADTVACRVTGASTGTAASLLLDFDGRDDINFEGEFADGEDSTLLQGALFGGGYTGQEITFVRED